jgi:pimeloyl-ACP methyl ester carboxylesterase
MILVGSLAAGAAALALVTVIGARRLEAAHPPEGRRVDVGGEVVHVVERGDRDAPALVLIHGASGNYRDLLIPLGETLARSHRVIAIDRPGHGASTRRTRALAAPDAQGRVIAAALRAVGVERAVVVGHSFGAAVALGLALEAPDLVAGLVLLAPVSHPWGPGGISWHNKVVAAPVIGPAFAALFPYPLGRLTISSVLPSVFRPDPVPEGYLTRVVPDLVLRPSAFRANAEDVVALQDNVTRLAHRYGTITAPVLVLEGARDPIVRNDIHAAGIAEVMPQAERVALPTGHMPHWAATADVLARIGTFAARAPVR